MSVRRVTAATLDFLNSRHVEGRTELQRVARRHTEQNLTKNRKKIYLTICYKINFSRRLLRTYFEIKKLLIAFCAEIYR